LSHANFKGADLSHAHLFNANLRHVNLTDANLEDADLRKADLSFAELSSCYLKNTWLSDTNLLTASVNHTVFSPNKSISESLKRNLIERGAIFENSSIKSKKINFLRTIWKRILTNTN